MTQPDPVPAVPTRRIKATDGMAVTADVWEEAHNYHRQHQELHAQFGHGAGILTGLQVVANDPADSAVYVRPGLAVDGNGHMIVLASPLTYELGTAAEGRLYLLVTYGESQSRGGNGRQDEDAPAYVQSQFGLAASSVLPPGPHVELARVLRVGRGAALVDAKDPEAPGPNEIDLRFRRLPAPAMTAPAGLALIHVGGAGPEHGHGAAALGRVLRAGGRYSLWVDDNVRLDSGIESYALLYLVGHGAFQLSANEMNALYAFLQAGGTVFAESCRRDPAAATAADASFASLFGSLGLRLESLPAGHNLLRAPAFFSALPAGYETGQAPQVQVADGVVYSRADYGCLWHGERRSGPATREEIRSAHELGENLAHLARQRAQRHSHK